MLTHELFDPAAYTGSSFASPGRSPADTSRHRDMALVEWWVLASAHWLAATQPSSFSTTAASWGLGPGGHMERADLPGGTLWRADWDSSNCSDAATADLYKDAAQL
jgi:hypothetical protein